MMIEPSPPTSWYIFMVGHCEEWPENRDTQGDIALHNEYVSAGVPPSQICYVRDKDCTKSNCQYQLEEFLHNIRPVILNEQRQGPATLLFYYGGHGVVHGFSTIEEKWLYRDVCQIINNLFVGQRVLYLLDCCASGNLWEYIPTTSQAPQQKQYVLIANAPPYITASDEGEEWVVTNSWIRCMRCHIRPSLATIIEFMSDRLALVLGNQAFSFMSITNTVTGIENADTNPCDDTPNVWTDPSIDRSWLPERNDNHGGSEEVLDWPKLQHNVPKEARVTHPKVGDTIVYKHPGGHIPQSLSSLGYIAPIWLYGTIVSMASSEDQTDGDASTQAVRIRVHHPVKLLEEWEITVEDTSQLLNGMWMADSWMFSTAYYKVQVRMAREYLQYLDFSALSAGTKIHVQTMTNQTIREGIVIDWRSYDWKKELRKLRENHRTAEEEEDDDDESTTTSDSSSSDTSKEHKADDAIKNSYLRGKSSLSKQISVAIRAFVPVEWIDNNLSNLVLLEDIVSPEIINTKTYPISLSEDKGLTYWARQALLRGIETSGNSIVNAASIFGTDTKLSGYWPEDDDWYDVKPIQKDLTELPLHVLASHAQFMLRGTYCPLHYEDGESHLSPAYYIRAKSRRRRCPC